MEPLPTEMALDVRGRPCPIPIIEAAKAMASIAPGGLLILRGNDPALAAELRAWCESTRHTLLSMDQTAAGLVARIAKARSLG
jgi:tRNA 2-thiouridine synthesizing protein A